MKRKYANKGIAVRLPQPDIETMNMNFKKYQMLNQRDETGRHFNSGRQNLWVP